MLSFKCYYKGLFDRYGNQYELNKTYTFKKIKPQSSGFHSCKNLEDTFRYYDTTKETVIAKVEISGDIIEFEDDYNGYYDMYCSSMIKILEVYEKEEIINIMKKSSSESKYRFIWTYNNLSEAEIREFYNHNNKYDKVNFMCNYKLKKLGVKK